MISIRETGEIDAGQDTGVSQESLLLDLTYYLVQLLVMKSMNVSEAKARFSALVEEVEKGETVTLCKRNVPVAKLVPSKPPEGERQHRTRIGWAKGKVQIRGDLTEPAIADDAWEMHE